MTDDKALEAPPPFDTEVVAEPPKAQKQNTLWILIAAIAVIWTCSLIVQVASGFAIVGIEYLRSGKVTNPIDSPNFLLFVTFLDWFSTLSIAFYFACKRVRTPLREAFALKPISMKVGIQSIAIGFGGSIAAALLLSWFGTGNAPIYDLAIKEKDGVASLAIPFMLLAILVPPFEEIYYRGFIFPILRSRLSAAWAISIVAAWFGLLHVAQLWGEWLGIVIVVILGTIWTFQRHRHESLYPSIISHLTYNIAIVATQSLALHLQ